MRTSPGTKLSSMAWPKAAPVATVARATNKLLIFIWFSLTRFVRVECVKSFRNEPCQRTICWKNYGSIPQENTGMNEIFLNCRGKNLAQFGFVERQRVGFHAAGESCFRTNIRDVLWGNPIGGQGRNFQVAAKLACPG